MKTLITTNLKETYGREEEILIAGDWIKSNLSFEEDFKDRKYKFFESIWKDDVEVNNFIPYLTDLRSKLINKLSKDLNAIHNMNYSTRSWEIMINPWLHYYLEGMYIRFETINRILNVLPQKYKLIIKVHPSDNINKYEKFLKNKNVIIKKNMKFKEMVQKPKKIIGIKSALLLKLSIFRSDIVSFRPKKDLMFIGEKLGVVKLVRKNLSRYIENKIINKHNFNKRFIGSKQKIKFFLQSKIIE